MFELKTYKMNKANLFKTKRLFIIAYSLLGLILFVLAIVHTDFTYNIALPVSLIFMAVVELRNLNKFYLMYDKEKVCWNYPNKEEELKSFYA